RPLAVRDGLPAARAPPARGGDRRPRGLAPAPVARLPVALAALRARRTDVAGDGLLHELDRPHARAQLLGRGDDARRRGRARPDQRQAEKRALAAGRAALVRRLRRGLPDPRGEPVALLALGVRPPRLRLDAAGRGAVPARSGAQAAVARLQRRLRARRRRGRGRAVQPARRRARLRPPEPERRGGAPVRRLALVVVVLLAFPATAWAHATLEQTSPKVGERLSASPRVVRLEFDQTVRALANAIQVFDAKGRLVSGTPHTLAGDSRVVVVPVRRLGRGGYTVRWATISNDSHVGRGVFTFGVRMAAPPISDAYGASGLGTSEHVVRWLYFLSLALLTGGLGFRLLVLRGAATPEVERRFYRFTGLGVVAALQVGTLAFLLRAEDALQLPFTAFLYGDLSPFANSTRFGKAFVVMELGFAVVAALLFLAWLTGRRLLLWAAFLLSLGLGSGLSLSSHQSDDRGWLPSFADWVHLSAATLWIGGLLSLAVVVWTDRELRRAAFWRFSEL